MIDLGKYVLGQADIHPHDPRRGRPDWNQNRHPVAIGGISHHLFEARRLRDRFAILDQSLEMKASASSAMARASSSVLPAVMTPGKSGNDTP